MVKSYTYRALNERLLNFEWHNYSNFFFSLQLLSIGNIFHKMAGPDKVMIVDICSEKVSVGFAGGESPEYVCKNVVGTSKSKVRHFIYLNVVALI